MGTWFGSLFLLLIVGSSVAAEEWDLPAYHTPAEAVQAVRAFLGEPRASVRYLGVSGDPGVFGTSSSFPWPTFELEAVGTPVGPMRVAVDPHSNRVVAAEAVNLRYSDEPVPVEARITPRQAYDIARSWARRCDPALLTPRSSWMICVDDDDVPVEQCPEFFGRPVNAIGVLAIWRSDTPTGAPWDRWFGASFELRPSDGALLAYSGTQAPPPVWHAALTEDQAKRIAIARMNNREFGYAVPWQVHCDYRPVSNETEPLAAAWEVHLLYLYRSWCEHIALKDGQDVQMGRCRQIDVDAQTGEVLYDEACPDGAIRTVKCDLTAFQAATWPETWWLSVPGRGCVTFSPVPAEQGGDAWVECHFAWQLHVKVLRSRDGVYLEGLRSRHVPRRDLWVRGRQVWLKVADLADVAGMAYKGSVGDRYLDFEPAAGFAPREVTVSHRSLR